MPASLPSASLEEAARRTWDVVVVGGGPAGALSAHLSARAGLATLLVERARYPRFKACGACLNLTAVTMLERAGLGTLPPDLGALPLRTFHVLAPEAHAEAALPGGWAVSRAALDAALAKAALDAGAVLLSPATALRTELEGDRRAVLARDSALRQATLHAKVVVAADGLDGGFLASQPEMGALVKQGARLGVGTIVAAAPGFFAPGDIFMACGVAGYAGLVRLENQTLDVAACLDVEALRNTRGPEEAVARILECAGLPRPDFRGCRWRGTPLMTRRRRHVAAERLFVVGDAAGFVEPFTGEGIAWALSGATALAPVLAGAAQRWEPELAGRWERLHRRLVVRRQQPCMFISYLARQAHLNRPLVKFLATAPLLIAPLLHYLERPYRATSPAPRLF